MKVALVLCLAFLLVSSINAQCVINSPVSAFGASCTSSQGCALSVQLVTTLIPDLANCIASLLTGIELVIAPTGSGTLNLQLTTGITYTSLNLTANPGVIINAVAAQTLNFVQNLVVAGEATLSVSEGAVVNVGNQLQVQAQATLNVAGNITANTAITVAGTVYFVGANIGTQAQKAWVVLKNTAQSISISGSASASANIQGNGGFDGSLSISGNATIAPGNSPGTVFVNGDLDMSPTTTLQIDVDSLLDHDLLLIQKQFKRDGILSVKFENNYVPPNNAIITFATHSSASGDFNLYHGNFGDSTWDGVKPQYSDTATSFKYSSASSVAASLFLISFLLSFFSFSFSFSFLFFSFLHFIYLFVAHGMALNRSTPTQPPVSNTVRPRQSPPPSSLSSSAPCWCCKHVY
eukprot:Phypoly_transcript_10619.p1 GENE.Phypoly_transcript_10619~~Phypoly_transcript_10619.p1  ORF type:complete len:407 (+),score=71.99 Phypoly_transcript_10619:47-1267(+)